MSKQRFELLLVAPAVHAAENIAVAVLYGYLEVFHELGLARDSVEELICYALGVAVERAYPSEPVYPAKFTQKLGQLRLAIDILTVAGSILRDDCELGNAVIGETPCLREHILHRHTAELPAYLRYSAVCAAVRAALRYLEVREEGQC